MLRILAAVCIAGLAPGPSLAAGEANKADRLTGQLVAGGRVIVSGVGDTGTVFLSNGREIKLASVRLPGRPLVVAKDAPWPPLEAAVSFLRELVGPSGAGLTLYYEAEREDRYGRLIAHVRNAEGLWVQEQLLAAGHARVWTGPQNNALAGPLLSAEQMARSGNRGLWQDSAYRVWCANDGADIAEGAQVVVGRVYDIARVRGITYINFSADWRRDFTIRILPGARRATGFFNETDGLVGARVEVRGVVFLENGPMIDLDHEAALRVLAGPVMEVSSTGRRDDDQCSTVTRQR